MISINREKGKWIDDYTQYSGCIILELYKRIKTLKLIKN